MNENIFDQMDFGALKEYLDNDDVTDISYSNNGQIWLKTLSKGLFRVENEKINNAFMEKLAFQCANVMGNTFNMAHPFLDAESAELRLNFVHDSIATNGIACVIRKTPAKIRLEKNKIIEQKYVEPDVLDLLEYCVKGHCNILVCGETGSGKTELVKYLASKIAEDEKIITIEDTLELHLNKIFPHRDIVAMKTNNIASYSDVLVTCMRQNPKWILLSEVRSAEAVMAVRNSISSGHYILSTIHADKAASIPERLYSLLETSQDMDQFLKTIYRYVQLGVYVRGYTDKETHSFKREIAEVTEFHVTRDNKPEYNVIYRKGADGKVIRTNPSEYLIDYLSVQGVYLPKELELMGEKVPLSEAEIKTKKQEDPFEMFRTDPTGNKNIVTNTEKQMANVNLPNNSNNQQAVNNIQPVNNLSSPTVNDIKPNFQPNVNQSINSNMINPETIISKNDAEQNMTNNQQIAGNTVQNNTINGADVNPNNVWNTNAQNN